MSSIIPIEKLSETTLYQVLKERKDDATAAIIEALPTICEEASNRVKLLPKFFFEYTLHDKTHFLRVTELMAKILGDNVCDLNNTEITLLILSAFFHDQGMLIDGKDLIELEQNDEYIIFKDNWYLEHPNYTEIKCQLQQDFLTLAEKQRLSSILCELDAAMLTDYLRESHGSRSYEYIIKNFSSDKRFEIAGINISNYLAKICISHVKSPEWINRVNGFHYDENIGQSKVNMVFISLVLRLADILDFDSDRTPDILFKSIHFTSIVSLIEWQKHRHVQGWEIAKDIIRFSMQFSHPVYEKTTRTFLDWVDAEINSAHKILREFPKEFSNYKISIPEKVDRSRIGPKNNSYVFHDMEFSLSRDEIVKLLMTDNLYKNSSLFVRELLQNSLDALRLRKALNKKDGLDWNDGYVSFDHYIDANNQEIIECFDNGCGMDENIITKFLGKVGRSYYRSPEFERQRIQLKEKGVDFEPCSQFGIGFMSCFMVGDRIEITTRKDYGIGKNFGKPLIVEINGLSGLVIVKDGIDTQEIGTRIKIFNREKPIFYDEWNDKIKLTTVLKGYALATEFPIKGKCSIDAIKSKVDIPTDIDKKKTFVERKGIKTIITLEVNLENINKNLRGILRQTFLSNDKGIPCIENDSAKWEIIENSAFENSEKLQIALFDKKSGKSYSYDHYFAEHRSICLDGILVCGSPGRQKYPRHEMHSLGEISARIYSEHPFTIDIRGNIKPELTPAREPLDRGSLNRSRGWRRVQDLLNLGSGQIWAQLLLYSNQGLSSETFWQLLLLHSGSLLSVPSQLLINYLKVPTLDGQWMNLYDIDEVFLDDNQISIKEKKGDTFTVSFPVEIARLGNARVNKVDLNWRLRNLFLSISEMTFSNNQYRLSIRTNFEENETPSKQILTEALSSVNCVDFTNLSTGYVIASAIPHVFNRKNPLARLAFDHRYSMGENELHTFADSFVYTITRLAYELKEDDLAFTLDVKSRPLKYLSHLFLNLSWEKYEDKYKPPYKIYVDENTTLEINEHTFQRWAKA